MVGRILQSEFFRHKHMDGGVCVSLRLGVYDSCEVVGTGCGGSVVTPFVVVYGDAYHRVAEQR